MRLVLGSIVTLAVLVSGAASAMEPEEQPCAARGEGYLGGAVLDPDGVDSESAFDGGGAGSIVCVLGPAFLQGDLFGDYAADFASFIDDISDVGAGGHLGLRDADLGAVALTGAYQELHIDGLGDLDFWRVGGEGELYLGMVSLGTQAGYLRSGDTNDDGFYARGLVRLYPTENIKLEGIGGYAEVDNDGLPQGSVLAEFRPEGWWASVFVRWEGTFDHDFLFPDTDSHAAVAGVRVYWDGGLSLQESDRTYFRDSCVFANAGARLC